MATNFLLLKVLLILTFQVVFYPTRRNLIAAKWDTDKEATQKKNGEKSSTKNDEAMKSKMNQSGVRQRQPLLSSGQETNFQWTGPNYQAMSESSSCELLSILKQTNSGFLSYQEMGNSLQILFNQKRVPWASNQITKKSKEEVNSTS